MKVAEFAESHGVLLIHFNLLNYIANMRSKLDWKPFRKPKGNPDFVCCYMECNEEIGSQITSPTLIKPIRQKL